MGRQYIAACKILLEYISGIIRDLGNFNHKTWMLGYTQPQWASDAPLPSCGGDLTNPHPQTPKCKHNGIETQAFPSFTLTSTSCRRISRWSAGRCTAPLAMSPWKWQCSSRGAGAWSPRRNVEPHCCFRSAQLRSSRSARDVLWKEVSRFFKHFTYATNFTTICTLASCKILHCNKFWQWVQKIVKTIRFESNWCFILKKRFKISH